MRLRIGAAAHGRKRNREPGDDVAKPVECRDGNAKQPVFLFLVVFGIAALAHGFALGNGIDLNVIAKSGFHRVGDAACWAAFRRPCRNRAEWQILLS